MSADEFGESARAAFEESRTRREVFSTELSRVLCEELDLDQLETITAMIQIIANPSNPRSSHSLANHYEGMMLGILATRRRLTYQPEVPKPEATLWSHPYTGSMYVNKCDLCGMTQSLGKPHQRWDAELYGDGSNGVDLP